ncbi:uncharacterized protein MKK02DRAFT_39424 [Dioszegia hungarica]|uniref:Uncharacterized protein n=1 Tax=Dioszegia hungarica TaxID=4972 RepID=A0AA38HEY0_9TREE|nr:uncharacterized protein MKK02DRAFT_39424 [Dioszegia hungarica]KAI9639141.1 hypothetical protein MKK02DRAFT_39424 [Dioszegia hungarica]
MSSADSTRLSLSTICGLLYLKSVPIEAWTAMVEEHGYDVAAAHDLMGTDGRLRGLQRFRLNGWLTPRLRPARKRAQTTEKTAEPADQQAREKPAQPTDRQNLEQLLASKDPETISSLLRSSSGFTKPIFIHPIVLQALQEFQESFQESSLDTLPKIRESMQYLLTHHPGYEDYFLEVVKKYGFKKADVLLGLQEGTSLTMVEMNRAYTDDFLATMNDTNARSLTFFRRGHGDTVNERIQDQKHFREVIEGPDGLSRKQAFTHFQNQKRQNKQRWTDSTIDTKLPAWYQRMHDAAQSRWLESHLDGDETRNLLQTQVYKGILADTLKKVEDENLCRGLSLEPEIEKLWADRQRQNQSHFEPVIIATAAAASAPSPETDPDWQMPQNAPTASPDAAGVDDDMEHPAVEEFMAGCDWESGGTDLETSRGPGWAADEAPSDAYDVHVTDVEFPPCYW